MRADKAVERRHHIGVAVIDRGNPGVGLRLLQVGLRVVARGGGCIQRCLRNRLPRDQIGLAPEVCLSLLERRLGAGLRRLRLLELVLVGVGLDGEQRRAPLHELPVFVIDRLQHALHPRDEIDGFERRGVAGGLEKARHRALHWHGDVDLRRRRRHKTILFAGT